MLRVDAPPDTAAAVTYTLAELLTIAGSQLSSYADELLSLALVTLTLALTLSLTLALTLTLTLTLIRSSSPRVTAQSQRCAPWTARWCR